MAVYLLSLQQLAGARARRGEHDSRHPSELRTNDPEPSAPTNVAAIQEGRATSEVSPALATGLELSTPAEQLLEMSTMQLRALLCESNEPSNKVMLAVMYRLAVIEQQLAELTRRSTWGEQRPAPPVATPQIAEPFHGRSKSELLEQIFRKNLSLRGSD